jgi:tetratricopeptide (TPR) repeat protein
VTLRNYLVEKDFVPLVGNFGINFYLGNNPQATGAFFCPSSITMNQQDMFRDSKIIARMEQNGADLKTSEVSNFWARKSFDFIIHEPVVSLRLFLKKLSYLFSPQEYIFDNEYDFLRHKVGLFNFLFMTLKFIYPFWVLGMILCLRRIKAAAPLYVMILTISLSIALFFVTSRYRMVMMPFAMIFSGFAINEILSSMRQKRFIKSTLLCISVLLIFFLAALRTPRPGNLEYFRGDSAVFDEHMYKAFDYEQSGDYLNAIKESQLAHQAEPHNRRASFRLGVLYYRLNDLRQAEDKFKEAIKADGLSVDAYYNLGLIYNQQKRFNEARQMLQKAAFLDPDDPKILFELAVTYKSSGELLKAKNEFDRSLGKLSRWRTEDRKIIEEELKTLPVLK